MIGRKLGSSLDTFTGGLSRWVLLVWLVLAAAAVVGCRRGWLRLHPGVDRRVLRGLVAALLTAAVLGAALNDSGLAITAFVLYVAMPVLAPALEPTGRRPDRTRQEQVGPAEPARLAPGS